MAQDQHSLAHELAAALMPEPSAGSKLLAEEFGIEYDEGAEGVDDEQNVYDEQHVEDARSQYEYPDATGDQHHYDYGDDLHAVADADPAMDPAFGSPIDHRAQLPSRPDQDPMEVLSRDLQSTDSFLSHLRHLDGTDLSSSAYLSTQQTPLEVIAADVIRRIEDSTKDREAQLR
ncbi:hypothetical protein FISHEDRAFT_54186, partial [Fistulina hepatica ATCC 64428]